MLITCAPMLAACTIARAMRLDVVDLLPSLRVLVAGVGVLEAECLAGLADRDEVDIRGDAAVGVRRPRRRRRRVRRRRRARPVRG